MRQFTGTVTRIDLTEGLRGFFSVGLVLKIHIITENGNAVYDRHRVHIEYGSSDHRLREGDVVQIQPHWFKKTTFRVQ